MKNQVIEVLDRAHGRKVIEFWKSRGVDTYEITGAICKKDGHAHRFYGVINEEFKNYDITTVNACNAEIIELPTESPKEEKPFPRVMLVSDDAVVWMQAVVECLRDGYAFATIAYSSVEEYDTDLKKGAVVPFYLWKHYKELSDGNKVSKAEIAEMFNIPLDELEIVD